MTELPISAVAARNRRLILGATLLGNLNFQFGLWVLYLRAHDLSLAAIGVLQTVFSLAMFAGELPSGMAADRWGRKRVLVLGHVCIAAYMATMLLAPPFETLAVGFALMGLGVSCVSGAELAVLVDTAGDKTKRRTQLVGRYFALEAGALAVGTISGAALHALSWSAVFAAALGCELLAALLCLWLVPTRAGIAWQLTAREQLADLRASVSGDPTVIRLLLALGLFTGAISTIAFLAQDAMHEVGIPIGATSIVYGTATLVAIPAAIVSYRMERRLGIKVALTVMVALSILSVVLMGVGIAMVLVAAFIVLVALDSVVETIGQSALSAAAPGEHTASILSSRNLLASFVIAIGSPIVGFTGDDLGIAMALVVFGVILLFIVLALIAFARLPNPSPNVGAPELLQPIQQRG